MLPSPEEIPSCHPAGPGSISHHFGATRIGPHVCIIATWWFSCSSSPHNSLRSYNPLQHIKECAKRNKTQESKFGIQSHVPRVHPMDVLALEDNNVFFRVLF